MIIEMGVVFGVVVVVMVDKATRRGSSFLGNNATAVECLQTSSGTSVPQAVLYWYARHCFRRLKTVSWQRRL